MNLPNLSVRDHAASTIACIFVQDGLAKGEESE